MYAPVSTVSHQRTLVRQGLIMLAASAGLGLVALNAGMAQTPAPRGGATPVPAAQPAQVQSPGVRLLGTYHLRCWQEGQLVLEEALQQAPPDGAAQTLRLQGSAAAGTALVLLNVGTTTCLVKPARDR
jgi:hypothetical protein